MSDPATLIETLAKLKDDAKRIDDEITRVEAALTDYARAHPTTPLETATHRVKLVATTSFRTPEAGSARRASFDATLKGLGLWDEMMTLNAAKLGAFLKRDTAEDADKRQKLLPLVDVHEGVRVSLSEKRSRKDKGAKDVDD